MWEFLDKYWIKFINGYCKVGFLCENNDPNWLGWIPIGFIGILLSLSLIFGLLEAIEREIMGYINKRKKT